MVFELSNVGTWERNEVRNHTDECTGYLEQLYTLADRALGKMDYASAIATYSEVAYGGGILIGAGNPNYVGRVIMAYWNTGVAATLRSGEEDYKKASDAFEMADTYVKMCFEIDFPDAVKNLAKTYKKYLSHILPMYAKGASQTKIRKKLLKMF